MRKLVSMLMALCLLCAALPAFAEEAAPTETVTIDGVTFTIPAGLENTRATKNDAAYESDELSIVLVGWMADAEHQTLMQDMMAIMAEEGYPVTLDQAAIVFGEVMGGLDEDAAFSCGLETIPEDIGMLNGKAVMCGKELFVDQASYHAQYYRDHYFSVLVVSYTMTPEEIIRLSQEIMRSVRIEGVTEADMALDAQAE